MARQDSPAVTYASYLKVDELLALQQPRSDGSEHDEILLIIIHQVYELWVKEWDGFSAGSRARSELERRYQDPTLWDAFLWEIRSAL